VQSKEQEEKKKGVGSSYRRAGAAQSKEQEGKKRSSG